MEKFGYIVIDFEKCQGLGICYGVCPENVYDPVKDDKIVVARPDDCTQCRSCESACPEEAMKS